jgi:hypothetical protein
MKHRKGPDPNSGYTGMPGEHESGGMGWRVIVFDEPFLHTFNRKRGFDPGSSVPVKETVLNTNTVTL